MISIEQVQRLLDVSDYYAGWTFTARMSEYEGMLIRIKVETTNTYRPEDIVLGIDSYVPPSALATEDAFCDWMLWRLLRIASHECREGFKVYGRAWSDPHRPDRSAPAEDAVSTGTDQAPEEDQHDAEDDLALKQLNDADHHEDDGDDQEQ